MAEGSDQSSIGEVFPNFTPHEKINFYKASRVIFDNCTKALKKIYEREHGEEPPEEWDFSELATHLTSCKDACFHFFYCKIFEADIQSKGGSQCLLINVRDKCDTFSQLDFNDPDMRVCVNGSVSPIAHDESSDHDAFILKRSRQQNEKSGVVYKANDIHRSIRDVRKKRNDTLGHCKQVWTTDDCLEKLYKSVKEAYQLMEMKDENILQELEAIMSDKVVAEDAVKQIKDYYLVKIEMLCNMEDVFWKINDVLEEIRDRTKVQTSVQNIIHQHGPNSTVNIYNNPQVNGDVKPDRYQQSSSHQNCDSGRKAVEILRKSYADLCSDIPHPRELAVILYTNHVISRATNSNVSTPGWTNHDKNSEIMRSVEIAVKFDYKKLKIFAEALRDTCPEMETIADKILRHYNEEFPSDTQ